MQPIIELKSSSPLLPLEIPIFSTVFLGLRLGNTPTPNINSRRFQCSRVT